jgi:hypothetical protein
MYGYTSTSVVYKYNYTQGACIVTRLWTAQQASWSSNSYRGKSIFLSSEASRPAGKPTHVPAHWVWGGGLFCQPGHEAVLQLVPRLGMSGPTSSLLHMPS